MTIVIPRWCCLLLLGALAWAGLAGAQVPPSGVALVEPPAGGTGPLLVMLTGADGAPNHRLQAQAFSREGWLVHVVDSNQLMGGDSSGDLRALLQRSLAQPQVRSARAGLVGYSLGGWLVLAFGNRMPDLVASAVACYPSTFRAGEPKPFLANPPVGVPTLMLVGVKDTYMNCCTIERARAMAAAAALPEVGAPLRLVEYPEADHGFVLPAYRPVYRPADEADAFGRAVEHLRGAGAARQ
jgi:pimeloyl-ACP methyl ester carboxylesterase